MNITLQSNTFDILAERALFWQEKRILLVADTHFGKTGTFRQGGIPLPIGADSQGMTQLDALIERTQAERCIVLGDFFHSVINAEWVALKQWCQQRRAAGRPIELVPGNHDILKTADYLEAGIVIHGQHLIIDGIRLQHEPPEDDGPFTLCGHLHPGIALSGMGKQRLRLPCFWFTKKMGVLPAFGYFTGLWDVTPSEDDRLFVTTQTRQTTEYSGTIVQIKL
jgi:DNA ligase-associated metallophosphoesterase